MKTQELFQLVEMPENLTNLSRISNKMHNSDSKQTSNESFGEATEIKEPK